MSLILLVEGEAQICGMIHSILSWGTWVKGVSSALGQFDSASTTLLASYKTSGKLNNPLLQSSLV